MAHQGHEYIICAVWLPLTLHFIHRYSERLRILIWAMPQCPSRSQSSPISQITLYSMLLAIAYIPFCIAGSPLLRDWKTKLAHVAFAEIVVLGILAACSVVCRCFSVAESVSLILPANGSPMRCSRPIISRPGSSSHF